MDGIAILAPVRIVVMNGNVINMKNILFIIGIIGIVSCEPIEAILPNDWPIHVIDNDTIPQDSVVIDTLPTDTIVPCTDPIEYTDPAFVTAYWFTDDNITTDRQIIIGNHSQTVYSDNLDQQSQIIDSLFALAWPNYNYKTYVGADNKRLFTIIDGTNDRQQFYLKAQIRINGYKQYFGFATQAFTFCGAADPVVYNELASLYPSVNQWDFYGTDWTEDEYIKTALKVIGECKEGRWRAHFGLQPNYTFPDSIIQKAIDAGWEKVLN